MKAGEARGCRSSVGTIIVRNDLLNTYRLARRAIWLLCQQPTGQRLRYARRLLAYRLIYGDVDTLTFRRGDTTWTTYGHDWYCSWHLFGAGAFEPEQLETVIAWLQRNNRLDDPSRVILEVGANIGMSTIPLAKKTGLRVLAVEPIPANYELLRRNVQQNGLANRVMLANVAISDRPGTVTMVWHPEHMGSSEITNADGNAAISTIIDIDHHVEVDAVPINDMLEANGIRPADIAFVWCDVQGHERQLVESGAELWANGVPLLTELWPYALNVHGGIPAFLTTVQRYFHQFIPLDRLRRDDVRARPQPITAMASFMSGLRGIAWSNVLLLADVRGNAPARPDPSQDAAAQVQFSNPRHTDAPRP